MVSAAILAQQRRQFLCAREQLEPFVGGGGVLVAKKCETEMQETVRGEGRTGRRH